MYDLIFHQRSRWRSAKNLYRRNIPGISIHGVVTVTNTWRRNNTMCVRYRHIVVMWLSYTAEYPSVSKWTGSASSRVALEFYWKWVVVWPKFVALTLARGAVQCSATYKAKNPEIKVEQGFVIVQLELTSLLLPSISLTIPVKFCCTDM